MLLGLRALGSSLIMYCSKVLSMPASPPNNEVKPPPCHAANGGGGSFSASKTIDGVFLNVYLEYSAA